MSSWEGSYDEVLPQPKSPSLPEANKMARMLRTGRTVNELALRYGAESALIVQRLTSNGWDPSTGRWTGGDPKDFRAAPLAVRGDGPGQACHHVGGGDNPSVVPVVARPIRERPKLRGIVWPDPPATPTTATTNAPRARRTQTPLRAISNEGRRKLTPSQRAEIARRYMDGLESSAVLAEEYGVNQRTIRKAIIEQGGRIRSRSEASTVRWRNENGAA